ncbi:ABC transporter permease [uncultured Ferrovibrio sp.]|jgi:peptide/nickel transport system permease protein|uniref:ABC transporter permease n=1 Tax=uncultured Ferrovibrio sp. TaxID=1576913 RepID=UPI002635F004|nr:ABC transporter permease [uncultured Ferrovibrio sp.]
MSDVTLPAQTTAPAKTESPIKRIIAEFVESKLAVFGFILLMFFALAAIFGPYVAPQDPYDLANLDILDARLPPGEVSGTGMTFLLGSDGQGRDMLSAMLYGLRISLFVGVTAVALALAIGAFAGLLAAYAGGRIDTFIMRVVDIQLSFPAILVALILLAVLGNGVDKVIIALVVVQWAYFARAARGAALVERSKEYVEAARCLGLSRARLLLRHLLPNCMPPLIVIATIDIARSITLEATLSFLGLGVPVTEPSLGMLIANGFDYLLSGVYWISLFPGLLLTLVIIAINLVGDQLRDVLNPRLKR